MHQRRCPRLVEHGANLANVAADSGEFPLRTARLPPPSPVDDRCRTHTDAYSQTDRWKWRDNPRTGVRWGATVVRHGATWQTRIDIRLGDGADEGGVVRDAACLHPLPHSRRLWRNAADRYDAGHHLDHRGSTGR